MKKLKENVSLQQAAIVFDNPNSTHAQVKEAGVVNVKEQDAKMPPLFLKMKKLKLILMMSYSQSKRKIKHEI